jgi:Asp-tRNA(Asn)/Glu-tRNA(Gln) amidotransferase A subunit family amidase
MSSDTCYLSALEAAQLFRDRKLSPVELLEAQIARAESVEPVINAFSHTFYEQALDQARKAEDRYVHGNPMGVLDGLAVAMKDEIDVKGQPNTEGSLIYQDRVAEEDSVLTDRLRAAGAIFHARTTCPEFCTLLNTHNRLFGVTRNPWNPDITPGGSSGGSGASLAVGTATLATGSDIGGSIRYPASQCGLVGFKPPYGRVPETYEPFNLEPYCANGPMARTVADTALMQNIMSGSTPGDAASNLDKVELPLTYEHHLKGRRIAFSMDLGYLAIDNDVVRNTHEMLDRLRQLGAEVVEVDLGWPAGIERAYNGHMDPLFWAGMFDNMDSQGESMCDYNLHMAEQARERLNDKTAYYDALCVESQMYASFGRMMESFDAFVCPTSLSTRLRADHNPAQEEYEINGEILDSELEISTCHQFNMMGRCPAISVPSGLGDNGVPTGRQIVSSAYDDVAVFRVAAALESTWPQGRSIALTTLPASESSTAC